MGFFDLFAPKGKQIAGGIRGTAQVVSTTGYFGRAVLQNARVNLVLNGDGITPTAVLYEGLIHNQKWPHPGQVLPAMIDRGNPQNYSILWEEVPNSKDAAAATAQGIAAAMAGDPSQLQNVIGTPTFSNVQVMGDVSAVTPEAKAKLAAFGIDLDAIIAQSKASGTFQPGEGVVMADGQDAAAAMRQFFGSSVGAAALGAAGVGGSAVGSAGAVEDTATGLERLAALHRAGSLTDAEFTEAKRKLLAGS
jgi:hypothetical protein